MVSEPSGPKDPGKHRQVANFIDRLQAEFQKQCLELKATRMEEVTGQSEIGSFIQSDLCFKFFGIPSPEFTDDFTDLYNSQERSTDLRIW